MSLDDEDLVEALRAENEVLRQKVEMLDRSAREYRRQQAAMLESLSWRVTAPLRRVVLGSRKTRRWVRRLPARMSTRSGEYRTPTAGLFPPTAPSPSSLAAGSPLLNPAATLAPAAVEPPGPEHVPSARILVVAHAFYPEVWPDIEDRLVRVNEAFDLVVTLVRGQSEVLKPHLAQRYPHARVLVVDNGGRDMAPLLRLAAMGVFDGYEAILKVHTKRSPYRLDGDAWRVRLLDGVLPSPEGVARILELLRIDPDVGIVVPAGNLLGAETWGSDRQLVESLAARFPVGFDPEALRYPAGSMYWVKPWVLRRLADLWLNPSDFEAEAGQMDGATAHALERFVGVVATASGLDQVDTDDVASRLHRARRSQRGRRPKVLAFYLPQYHRITENDEWWGEGFTDWDRVDSAEPLYEGHAVPRRPGELGRYDLSDPDVLRAQSALAAEYGVDGFVLYHYWFDGQVVLDTPLRNLLADHDVDVPFALCWANENWTRRWDGLDSEILVAQTYPMGWEDQYYDDVVSALRDSRYIRVEGAPLLLVYRPAAHPSIAAAVRRWKERARADGLGGLHVLGVTPSRDFEPLTREVAEALDGLVRFPPGSGIGLRSVRAQAPGVHDDHDGEIYSYEAAIDLADLVTVGPAGLPVHPGVMPGWDNTARRGTAAYVFHGANPMSFRRWVKRAADSAQAAANPMVFVNAWNEWAEGACLEPDVRFGRAYLEAVRDVVGDRPRVDGSTSRRAASQSVRT